MSIIDPWSDDSILSRYGYSADGTLSETGRRLALDRIINKFDFDKLLEAIEHFKWLIEDRGYRMPNANRIWQEDLKYFITKMNEKSQNILLQDQSSQNKL